MAHAKRNQGTSRNGSAEANPGRMTGTRPAHEVQPKGAAKQPYAGKRTAESIAKEALVRSFQPERGVVVIEFEQDRTRYTRERTPDQIVAMADYLRARRGFSTDQEMAELLDVHRTRLAAWKRGDEVPNAQNAQLLSHLAVVVHELGEFLDPEVIPDWLLTEQFTLDGATPIDALRAGQLTEVLQAANATEHGAFV